MKRFLSIFVAIVMTMTMVVPAFAYNDTNDSDYNEAITHLSGLGIINGYDDGSFQPEKVVTRAEMAKLLVVALGLEAGASLLEGTSSFDDVPTSHWATGYIAVAVQYGLIKGDGDGNFRPDDTVNYAEVATMILRALGYDRVVDKNGQWPTNYLNKANELKVFEDIMGSFLGTDGASRGTVAQMLWNMMNTNMWIVKSENETDGISYGKGDTMLNEKFTNYQYVEDMKYVGAAIGNDDESWEVTLEFKDTILDTETVNNDRLEYTGTDFYKFVPETIFNALVDTRNDIIVSMFADEDNYLVEGVVEHLISDGYTKLTRDDSLATALTLATGVLTPYNDSYLYLLMDGNKKSSNVLGYVEILSTNNDVIKEITETNSATKIKFDKNNQITVNDTTTEYDVVPVLKDGVLGTVLDLEEGDVVTGINLDANLATVELFIVSEESASGEFEGYFNKTTATKTLEYVTIDDEHFAIVKANGDVALKEIDDDGDETNATTTEFFTEKVADNDYVGQDVTVLINAFGQIVKVIINEIDTIATEDSYYLVYNGAVGTSVDGNTIRLINEDGIDTYTFASKIFVKGTTFIAGTSYIKVNGDYEKTATGATAPALYYDQVAYSAAPALTKGTMYWVDFNDDNEIIAAFAVADGASIENNAKPDKTYAIKVASSTLGNSSSDKDNYIAALTVASAIEYRINTTTPVYTIAEIEDNNVGTGKYSLEVSTGIDDIKGVAATNILLAIEGGEVVAVVITGSSTSDYLYGVIESISSDYITIDGVEYELGTNTTPAAVAGNFVAFTVTDDEADIVETFTFAGVCVAANQVTDKEDYKITINSARVEYLDEFEDDDAYDDYAVVVLDYNVHNNVNYFENEMTTITLDADDLDNYIDEGTAFLIDVSSEVIIIVPNAY